MEKMNSQIYPVKPVYEIVMKFATLWFPGRGDVTKVWSDLALYKATSIFRFENEDRISS
ncbi:uncharacterized protein METZ01_LOCUS102304 [marine metagenome]|uniref:Uncharacterized protein n=1 Tax=marine metagenome TaxID=408172 RepID=A0A381WA80_9ZZZZ